MGIGFASVACVLTNLAFFCNLLELLSGRQVDLMEEYYPHHLALLYFLFFSISISFPLLAAAAIVLH